MAACNSGRIRTGLHTSPASSRSQRSQPSSRSNGPEEAVGPDNLDRVSGPLDTNGAVGPNDAARAVGPDYPQRRTRPARASRGRAERPPQRTRWSHAMIVSCTMVVPATNAYVLRTVCILRTYLRDGRQEACGGRPGDHRVQPRDVRVPRARPEDVRDGRRPSASASLMRTMCWWGTLTPMMFALLCAHRTCAKCGKVR